MNFERLIEICREIEAEELEKYQELAGEQFQELVSIITQLEYVVDKLGSLEPDIKVLHDLSIACANYSARREAENGR